MRLHPPRDVLAFAVLAALATALLPRIPQPPDYHQFIDTRTLLGVPNFWNVISNLPFVLVGAAGLALLRRNPPGALPALRQVYRAVFAGSVLIGLGSAWYHLAPDNDTLLWDRLPMALTFMALFAMVLGEHVDARLARRALVPLVCIGMGSVLYWWISEALGAGDLRPYLLVQFLPMLLLPYLLLRQPSVFDRTRELWGLIALYALAKSLELADAAIYAAGQWISGHSLKHLVAAAALALLLHAMRRRRLRADRTVA